jgi:hypothetical protein
MRAGANRKTAKRILRKVRSQVYSDIGTSDIYKLVLQAISEEKDGKALYQKYQLKDAIMRLGPAGFAFENYVKELLEHQGIQIEKIRAIIKGKCINHEIDLIAILDWKKIMIECKYHSHHGNYVGLKDSLYVHARFLDTQPEFDGEAIICNTKISQNARKYSKCIGQQVFSWRYPLGKSLEKIIEDNKLYPVTILSLNSKELEMLFKNNIMIAKNILKYDAGYLSKITSISQKRINNLQDLIKQIIQ